MIDIQDHHVRLALVGLCAAIALFYPLTAPDFQREPRRWMWIAIAGTFAGMCVLPLLAGVYLTNSHLSARDALLLKGNALLIGGAYVAAVCVIRFLLLTVRQSVSDA